MVRFSSSFLSFVVLASLSSFTSLASAADRVSPPIMGGTDIEEARAAFTLGAALSKEGKWMDALAAFQRSAVLKPHPITTYNIAYCERALGHYARAVERFSTALAPLPDADVLPPNLAEEAKRYEGEARRRIARVAVTLSEPLREFLVDGMPLELAVGRPGDAVFLVAAESDEREAPLLRELELWLDPGTHVFVVVKGNGARAVESRTFDAGASATLTLPEAESLPAPLPAVPDRKPAARVPVVAPKPNRLPVLIAFGVGGAGLAVAGVFGGLALGEKLSLDADPRCVHKVCPDEAPFRDREARLGRFADVATVGVVVGGVGAAAGVTLLLTGKPTTGAPSATRLQPWLGFGSAGVSGAF